MKPRDLVDQKTTLWNLFRRDLFRILCAKKAEFDEAVMSNKSEGLYTVDKQGFVSYMNPTAEKLFGWTLEEIRGKKMHGHNTLTSIVMDLLFPLPNVPA
jgi:PAS domain-containing protein